MAECAVGVVAENRCISARLDGGLGGPDLLGSGGPNSEGFERTPANGASSVDSLRKPVRGVLDRPSALTTRFRVFGSRDKLNKASLVEGERLARDDIDQGERRRDRREGLVLINQTIIQIRLKPHRHD